MEYFDKSNSMNSIKPENCDPMVFRLWLAVKRETNFFTLMASQKSMVDNWLSPHSWIKVLLVWLLHLLFMLFPRQDASCKLPLSNQSVRYGPLSLMVQWHSKQQQSPGEMASSTCCCWLWTICDEPQIRIVYILATWKMFKFSYNCHNYVICNYLWKTSGNGERATWASTSDRSRVPSSRDPSITSGGRAIMCTWNRPVEEIGGASRNLTDYMFLMSQPPQSYLWHNRHHVKHIHYDGRPLHPCNMFSTSLNKEKGSLWGGHTCECFNTDLILLNKLQSQVN